jgi:3-oxoacyl-(acyl-carrier-protein) synthase/acyl carrier protein
VGLSLGNTHLHPVMGDALLQILGPFVPKGSFFLPFSCDRVRFKKLDRTKAQGRLRLREPNLPDSETISADLQLHLPEGGIVGEIIGFKVRRANWETLGDRANKDKNSNLIYKRRWEKIEISSNCGTRTVTAVVGGAAAIPEIFRQEFRNVEVVSAEELGQIQADHILHIVNSKKAAPSDLISSAYENLKSCVEIARSSLKMQRRPRLWLALDLDGLDSVMVSGLVRALNFEEPGFKVATVEADSWSSENVTKLRQIMDSDIDESEIRLSQGHILAARLGRLTRDQLALAPRLPIRNDRRYLLTGGLGGLGFEVANHLIKSGARHLIIIGRSELKDEKLQRFHILSEKAKIEYIAADIADFEALQSKLKGLQENQMPWGGVIHMAVTYQDGAFFNLDWKSFELVLNPKVGGVWNLHNFFGDIPLDFFTCFSAQAGYMGNWGQTNYICANTFLDAFARFRSRSGHPTTAVAWGAWGESGFVKTSGLEQKLAQKGFLSLSNEEGMAGLDLALRSGIPEFAYCKVDWSIVLKTVRSPLSLNFFSELKTGMGGSQGLIPKQESRNDGAPEAQHAVSAMIKSMVGKVLGRDPSKIDGDMPFSEMGMDSIMLMELKSELEQVANLNLSSSLVFDYPTTNKLIQFFKENQKASPAKASLDNRENGTELGNSILGAVAKVIGKDSSKIDLDQPFFEMGIDSIMLSELAVDLESQLGVSIPSSTLFDYPTVNKLSEYLKTRTVPNVPVDSKAIRQPKTSAYKNAVAVIGMGCRFPHSISTPDSFWEHLERGSDLRSEIPQSRFDVRSLYSGKKEKGKVVTKWGYFLDDIDNFDLKLARVNPADKKNIDPQQLLVISVTKAALLDAGFTDNSFPAEKCGVYVGAGSFENYVKHTLRGLDAIDAHLTSGNTLNIISARTAYVFGLGGPSVSVDAACASSLYSLHLACQGILNGDCDMAVTGGVNLYITPESWVGNSLAGMLAPDGRCKTFDVNADGYARGEGCGILILKNYERAVADGNDIRAVILGSAVGNNGRGGGLTVPNGPAQVRVIRQALARAKVDPDSVGFIECHGTGTSLGDPIETNAIAQIFGSRKSSIPLYLGALKTNIGHLESAAGVAALIKTILALRKRQIPRNLNFSSLNPKVELVGPLLLATKNTATPDLSVAGVSSFGFGGQNGHAIVALPEVLV